MAKTNPIQLFGFSTAVLYDPTTGEHFGKPIEVGQSSSFASEQELIENVGGCSAYPYGVAEGRSTAEGSVSFNELSPWMLAKMAGGTVVINGAEPGGNVSPLADLVGSSITDVSTGLIVGAKSGKRVKPCFWSV